MKPKVTEQKENKVKEKIGDWFIDISKYLMTAGVISLVLTDIQGIWLYLVTAISSILTLVIGLLFYTQKTK